MSTGGQILKLGKRSSTRRNTIQMSGIPFFKMGYALCRDLSGAIRSTLYARAQIALPSFALANGDGVCATRC